MPCVYKPDPTRKRYEKYNKEVIKKAVEEYSFSRNAKLEDVAKKIWYTQIGVVSPQYPGYEATWRSKSFIR